MIKNSIDLIHPDLQALNVGVDRGHATLQPRHVFAQRREKFGRHVPNLLAVSYFPEQQAALAAVRATGSWPSAAPVHHCGRHA